MWTDFSTNRRTFFEHLFWSSAILELRNFFLSEKSGLFFSQHGCFNNIPKTIVFWGKVVGGIEPSRSEINWHQIDKTGMRDL